MTKRQVTRTLGPPDERTETAPTADRYRRLAGARKFLRERDYWYYPGPRDESGETMVVFELGRVVDATAA